MVFKKIMLKKKKNISIIKIRIRIKKNSELNDKSESTNQIKKLSDSNIRFKAKDSDDEEKAQLMLEKKFEEENINNNKKNEKQLYEISLNSKIITNDYNKEKVLREWINPNKEIKIKLLF